MDDLPASDTTATTLVPVGTLKLPVLSIVSLVLMFVEGLGNILLQTPIGAVPLSKVATIEDGDGPNQISRDDGKRRIGLLVKLARQSANQVLNRFADSNLGTSGAALLLLDLLQVATDGCL